MSWDAKQDEVTIRLFLKAQRGKGDCVILELVMAGQGSIRELVDVHEGTCRLAMRVSTEKTIVAFSRAPWPVPVRGHES